MDTSTGSNEDPKEVVAVQIDVAVRHTHTPGTPSPDQPRAAVPGGRVVLTSSPASLTRRKPCPVAVTICIPLGSTNPYHAPPQTVPLPLIMCIRLSYAPPSIGLKGRAYDDTSLLARRRLLPTGACGLARTTDGRGALPLASCCASTRTSRAAAAPCTAGCRGWRARRAPAIPYSRWPRACTADRPPRRGRRGGIQTTGARACTPPRR